MNIINKKTSFIIIMGCMICCMLVGCQEKQTQDRQDTIDYTTDFQEDDRETYEESDSEEVTETESELTTEEVLAEKKENPRENILIAIDPGHQSENVDMSASEPNAPGSSEMKMKATGGTCGKYTGVPEYKLNLDISLLLRDALEDKGYRVLMTREDNETAISNMERACLANDAGADVAVRIHANGSDDTSTNGALALIGSKDNQYVGHLYESSYRLADSILTSYCESTGMKNLGVTSNDTMTGINWSQIPVMILEMGFMSNEGDDRNMEDDAYREKMVYGIVTGIENYYGFNDLDSDALEIEEQGNDSGDRLREDEDLKETVDALLEAERANGTVASAYLKNLKTGEYVDLSTATHRSASIIKLFIAGCVYQNLEMIKAGYDYTEDNIDELVRKMITVSDNDAANKLVRILGSGDDESGMRKVTSYANTLGCSDTKMERLMLDFDSDKDNYTTVTDTGLFVEKLYLGEISGSPKILSYMKSQERRAKIPAGLPSGTECANKTGELDDVEHDVAIVYGENADYIICVMLSQLPDCAGGRETIKNISTKVYEAWK